MTGTESIGRSATCPCSLRLYEKIDAKKPPPKFEFPNIKIVNPETLLRFCAYTVSAPAVALATVAASVTSMCFGGGCIAFGCLYEKDDPTRNCIHDLGERACCSVPCKVVTRVNRSYYCYVFSSSIKQK